MNFAQALEQLVHGNLVTRGNSSDFIFMQIPSDCTNSPFFYTANKEKDFINNS